ncbi:hypothetical protein EDD37DRAFT_381912 [Exophiala viscosa]|uniref:uncharacterized protein n=1 Tax=Exophiala viscosa TaxID=2486360 RepID=UPI002197EFF0|nr:hypothetical protein EDD37DRAFT_381912 [Exophiala viscosa]
MERSPSLVSDPTTVTARARGRPRKIRSTKCSTCGQEFSKMEHLQRHERAHTGERPFSCPHCDKRFSRRDVLNRHAQKHEPLAEEHVKPSMLPHEARQDYQEPEDSPFHAEHQPRRKSRPATIDMDSMNPILKSPSANLDPPTESWDQSAGMLTPSTEPVQHAYSDKIPSANNNVDLQIFETGTDAMDTSFLDGLDFDLAGADDPRWNAPDFAAFNFAFPTCWIPNPSQPSQPTYGVDSLHTPRDDIPDERFDRVRKYWPTVKTDAQISRRIWDQVVTHPEDNIFSQSVSSFATPSVDESSLDSKWNFGEACRLRLMETLGVSLGSQNPKFPSASTLDFSVDLFFVQFHKFVPCIHVATFDASKTPSILLLAICMVGSAMMKSPAGNQFVENNMVNLIAHCRQELKSIHSQTTAAPMLAALASSYLTMILALITAMFDTEACQSLYVETIATMISHGFFGDNKISILANDFDNQVLHDRYSWKAWGRIESIKRLVIAIVMIDALYSDALDLVPVIPTNMFNLCLPSDEKLFYAASETDWRRALQAGCGISSSIIEFSADRVSLSSRNLGMSTCGLHGILSTVWLRQSEAHHRLISRSDLSSHRWGLVPYEVYSTDHFAKPLAPFLVNVMQRHGDTLQNLNPHCLIMWNTLCMMLLGNPWMFELGAGRQGAKPAKAALNCIASWADTPAARRACVHAAQIFWICSKRKISDSMMLHSETGLFLSALVLGLYVLVIRTSVQDGLRHASYELLTDLDWRQVGDVGLGGTTPYGKVLTPLADFIANGGNLTFSGMPVFGGYSSARRILVQFANLLEDAGMWRVTETCRILHIMGDVLMENGVEESAKSVAPFYRR